MFDKLRLKEALAGYKNDFFPNIWNSGKYKWEAVKHFSENWNINAADFGGMLRRSLDKTPDLLDSENGFPRQTVEAFADTASAEVRLMFADLYDESKDVYERIKAFKDGASVMLEKYGNGASRHYQSESAISVYLWLRYPDKYYIYMYPEVKATAEYLGADYVFKKGASRENIKNAEKFYGEVNNEIKLDVELVNAVRSRLTDTCYPDPELTTLTGDVCLYISRLPAIENVDEALSPGGGWFPEDYEPGLTVDDWVALINDKSVFTESALEIMKRMRDTGGKASCLGLSEKYGGAKEFYISGSIALARRVAEKTGCPIMGINDENARWWPILYVGGKSGKEKAGSCIWKLRDELAAALDRTDLSGVRLYAGADSECETYTETDFLNEVFMSKSRYIMLKSLLKNKKNIILQGAPGVGKTFAAKRLAYSIMGKKDESRVEFVQFHQNYSYEDFMMGYKPSGNGFELKYGVFYKFCQKAADNPEKDCFFIIDEINRGNMSKIFGELLMLIEKAYRGFKTTLAYGGFPFSVPENLYIIGIMNTADRSLAMIDYALRRRFGFFEMEPAFDSEKFTEYQKSLNSETFDELIDRVKELNADITSDKALGKGFCIGHSYFCGYDGVDDNLLRSIVEFDILPTLGEYWFDDAAKLRHWENIFRGIFE